MTAPAAERLDAMKSRFAPKWPPNIGVGNGWLPLLMDLDDALAQQCPDARYVQIKVKFDQLRVYLTGGNDAARQLVREAEERAARTCEWCASDDGEPHAKGYGCLIVCPPCADAHNAEHPDDPMRVCDDGN